GGSSFPPGPGLHSGSSRPAIRNGGHNQGERGSAHECHVRDSPPGIWCTTKRMSKLRSPAMRPLPITSHRVPYLLPVLVACCFAVSAQAEPTATKSGNWSARTTWADGAVPAPGSVVTIPAGTNVVLDVSPPALNGLSIDGKLTFANNRDVEL